jgi:hypothetical protein
MIGFVFMVLLFSLSLAIEYSPLHCRYDEVLVTLNDSLERGASVCASCYDHGAPMPAFDYDWCSFQVWLNMLQDAWTSLHPMYLYFARRNDSYLFCSSCDNGTYLNYRKRLPNCSSGSEFLIETRSCSFPCFRPIDSNADPVKYVPAELKQLEKGDEVRGPFFNEAIRAASGFDIHINFSDVNVTNINGTHQHWVFYFGYPTLAFSLPAYFSPCTQEYNASIGALSNILTEFMDLFMFAPAGDLEFVIHDANTSNCSIQINIFFYPDPTPHDSCTVMESYRDLLLCLELPAIFGSLLFVVSLVLGIRFLVNYNTSDIHSLPAEISWSFLLYAKYPFTWTGRWSYSGMSINFCNPTFSDKFGKIFDSVLCYSEFQC